jgi:hypothetical protein
MAVSNREGGALALHPPSGIYRSVRPEIHFSIVLDPESGLLFIDANFGHNSYATGIEQVCTLKQALAVSVESFKFSSRYIGDAYELS